MATGTGLGAVGRWSAAKLRAARAKGDDIIVVDVRTADARALHREQIPGARWIPLAEVAERARGLPRTASIVTYCT